MAEAVVTFFLQKLDILITGEANLLQGVDEEIRLLKRKMEWMRLFLENADAKRRSDPEVKLTVKQIREITFQAEDVIDEFIHKIHWDGGRRRTDFNWFTRSVKSIISCTSGIRHLPLRHELGNQIKSINAMCAEITANRSDYHFEGGSSNNIMSRQKNVMRAPIAEERDVVGLEDSSKQVISLLMGSGGDGRRRRIVVSIVGMGGLGKTTLAKKVFKNSDVKRNFNCFAWVSVSQEYILKDLLQSIIKCVSTLSKEEFEELEKLNEEELRNKLREYLLQGDKKYLIVLDDVWEIQAWDSLNTVFPNKMNGSRVLLTTRKKNIGMHADSSSHNVHVLRFLNEEESWELFMNKVFAFGGGSTGAEESKCPLELEEVAKEMVEKCGGLPLAILALGGLLSCKDKTFNEWYNVNNNLNWQLTHGAGSDSCSRILALSYYDLPYYLKPLFLYMSLFPEDYEIPASRLFQCWIAEGFVQSRSTKETLEDIAEDYLGELVHRSMIQVGRWRYDGKVRTCRVHDLLRDLAIAESKEDQFSQVIGSDVDFSKSNNVRRLTFQGDQVDDFNVEKQYFSQFHNARCVRSLMYSGIPCQDARFFTSLSGRFKLLKVLDVDNCGSSTIHLPEEIGELVHVKYLRLMYSMVYLPSSFSKLVNLQTLNFEKSSVICDPNHFSSLRQLRHLNIEIYHTTPRNPVCRTLDRVCWDMRSTHSHLRIGSLTNLQSLRLAKPGDVLVYIGRLDRLRMLRKLEIIGMPHPVDIEIYNDIAKMTSLRSLKLHGQREFLTLMQFSGNSNLTKLSLDGSLSSEFLFPPNLINLSLWDSYIETDLMVEVLAKLQNLKFLKLSGNACIGKKMVLSQGGFLRLKVLILEWLQQLEELIVEKGALISLNHLTITGCKKLKMLPEGLRQLTTLEELKVSSMPEEFMGRLSENVGEDWEKIKHITSVKLVLRV